MEYDKEKHEYSDNGIIIPGVTTVIGDVGIFEYSKFVTTGKGTRIHKIMQNYIEGNLNWEAVKDEEIEMIQNFDELTKDFCFDICEQKLHNETWNYAGTCDYISHDWIGELKTGKAEPWHKLQLAAYVYCFEKKQGILIYIFDKKNPIRIYTRAELKESFTIFLYALNVYSFKHGE